METSSNCRAMASASILSPSEKLWGQREARWNPKGKSRDVTWCGGRIGEVVAGASSPAAASHTFGSKKGARWAFRTHPSCPQSLTGLNISRMTLRDYINIYIIKYKLKKNSVKNSMWKKMLWVFIFCFFVAVVVVVILFMDPHIPFMWWTAVFFCSKERKSRGGDNSLMVQRLEPVLWGLSARLHAVGRALLWCFDYVFCSHVSSPTHIIRHTQHVLQRLLTP